MLLEVIASSLEDVEIINNSKADRIELCVALEHEGLTPSISLLKKVINLKGNKGIMVMLRNHYDNFFVSNRQVKEIIHFIKKTKDWPFTGYVFGAINAKKEVDKEALSLVSKALENTNKTLTFHKAFDYVKDKLGAIELLNTFKKVQNVLTSGGTSGFVKNIELLKKMNTKYANKILIGGGVTLENLDFLVQNGFFNIHVGKEARKNKAWNFPINTKAIAKIKDKITKGT